MVGWNDVFWQLISVQANKFVDTLHELPVFTWAFRDVVEVGVMTIFCHERDSFDLLLKLHITRRQTADIHAFQFF